MAGLSSLLGANPVTAGVGMGLNVLGGIANVVGAVGQKNEAKKQLAAQKAFSTQQRSALKTGYGDLISQAKGLPTYQGDISRYLKTENEAEMAKRMASGGQVAGEGIMREQARQTTANTLAAARLGAGSGSDLLTAALMGQQQEGAQMQGIDLQVGQQRQQLQQQTQQNYLSSLGQTAAAQAQQAGMEFESQSQRAQQVLGLGREQLGQSMALEDQLFGQEQAKAAAVQQARSAIWSGIGGIAQGIGSGIMGMNAQQNQMDMLSKIYGAGKPTQELTNLRSAQGDYETLLKSGAFTPSKSITTGFPTANTAPYQAPMMLAPQSQTNYSNLVNLTGR
jgi:hypothetical protein